MKYLYSKLEDKVHSDPTHAHTQTKPDLHITRQ